VRRRSQAAGPNVPRLDEFPGRQGPTQTRLVSLGKREHTCVTWADEKGASYHQVADTSTKFKNNPNRFVTVAGWLLDRHDQMGGAGDVSAFTTATCYLRALPRLSEQQTNGQRVLLTTWPISGFHSPSYTAGQARASHPARNLTLPHQTRRVSFWVMDQPNDYGHVFGTITGPLPGLSVSRRRRKIALHQNNPGR